MTEVYIKYNPYTVSTTIQVDGEEQIGTIQSYIGGKRLQEWIEPRGSNWKGIFSELAKAYNDREHLKLTFYGTAYDFEDIVYAKEKYGDDIIDKIELVHENKDNAPSSRGKLEQLRKLYEELQNGPVEEFKTEDIKKGFESAFNSDFEIVVVAPMSSGKSTLINSILGKDLLPAVNTATTAVITRIRDNDDMESFLVSCTDKYGNVICDNDEADINLISKLNYMIDPRDPEGNESLIDEINIEGPIPTLPSDNLNTVFVDTPGGNNAQNTEHGRVMDKAINDESKSLILYVFNGTQTGTNDGDVILSKIAGAMQASCNGKQSRDRFIFVANKMDDFDLEKEDYAEYMKNTIIPDLKHYGIMEPNLFLTSAQTARLIRISRGGARLTETEEDDLDILTKKFTRDNRRLFEFSSLNTAQKNKMNGEADRIKAEHAGEKRIAEVAEINSGVPAVEEAIREYLEKYAMNIKIKIAHDTFMKKVTERDMKNRCQASWAASQENYDNIRDEITRKRKKYEETNKVKTYSDRIKQIKIDKSDIIKYADKTIKNFTELCNKDYEAVEVKDAVKKLGSIQNDMQTSLNKADKQLTDYIDKNVIEECTRILTEYKDYVARLEEEELLDIGGIEISAIAEAPSIRIDDLRDFIADSQYSEVRSVVVGSHRERKSGFFNAVRRFFGRDTGWETVNDYADKEFVFIKDIVKDQGAKILTEFNKSLDNKINKTASAIETLKKLAMDKLSNLDLIIQKTLNEIEEKTKDRELLKKEVEENRRTAEWVSEFITKVDGILDI